MAPQEIFLIDMTLGYFAWALCIAVYIWPRLKGVNRVEAHRAIATLHSFRFFGLVFLLPGFVGPNLAEAFAAPSAYGDLATAILAILALLTVRIRILFWPLVLAFNLVGLGDLVMDTVNVARLHLPFVAGQFGAGYAIPILYVPLLFWTHLLALWLLWSARKPAASTGTSMAFAATD